MTQSLSSNFSPGTHRVSGLALLRWTLAALILTGGLMSAVMVLAERLDWWRGFIGASLISIPTAFAGLFPIILIAARGTASQLAFGFLAGTFLRMIAVFSLLLIATNAYELPKLPTAVLTLIYYFAVLFVEVSVLVSQMRRAFPFPKGPTLAA